MESQNLAKHNNQNKALFSLLPSEFIRKALLALPDRSREVIVKRFNLNGEEKRTLEEIGRSLKITRERVRQIEKGSIAKIKEANKKEILEFNSTFRNLINNNGGIMAQEFFLEKAISFIEKDRGQKTKNREAEKRNLVLIIGLAQEIKSGLKSNKFKNIFYLDNKYLEIAATVLSEVVKIFEEGKKVMELSGILDKVKEKELLMKKNIVITEDSLHSYLMLSSEISTDINGLWGLKAWPFVFPRSVKDKAYLILLYKKAPLHFKDITQAIDEIWTKKKKPALVETVHNELIKDKRFVLVGRGVYALAERGYEKGTVQDIIKSVLTKNGRPMARAEIIKEVSGQRMVKPGTIILNLKNREIFDETEKGEYKLKAQNAK